MDTRKLSQVPYYLTAACFRCLLFPITNVDGTITISKMSKSKSGLTREPSYIFRNVLIPKPRLGR